MSRPGCRGAARQRRRARWSSLAAVALGAMGCGSEVTVVATGGSAGGGAADCVGPCGAHLWSKRLGSEGEQVVRRVETTAAGDVVLTGFYENDIDFGSGWSVSSVSPNVVAFGARLDAEGRPLGAFGVGTERCVSTSVPFVWTVQEERLLFGGLYSGSMALGGTVYETPEMQHVAEDCSFGPGHQGAAFGGFLALLEPDFGVRWSLGFGDPDYPPPPSGSSATPVSADFDVDDSIVVGGRLAGAMTIGSETLVAQGQQNPFVLRLDPTGELEWARRFGDGGADLLWWLRLASDGALWIGGSYEGTMQLGAEVLAGEGPEQGFMAKLEPDGALRWARATAVPLPGPVLTDQGHLVGALLVDEPVDLGGGTLTPGAEQGIVAYELDGQGQHRWSRLIASGAIDYVTHGFGERTGELVLAGTFGGAIDFGGGPLTSQAHRDLFLVKLDRGGRHVHSQRFGPAVVDPAHCQPADNRCTSVLSVAVDEQGHTVLGGILGVPTDFGGGVLSPVIGAVPELGEDGFVARYAP